MKQDILSMLNEVPNDKIPAFCRNPIYLTVSGSHAYGLSTSESDVDVIGVVIPPESYVNPYKHGYIPLYDNLPTFKQWNYSTEYNNIEYDITLYSLPRYFRLCVDGNINIVETLFTESEHQIVCTEEGQQFLDIKKDFLSLNCYYKFMDFANAHKKRLENGRGRKYEIEKYGWDRKDGAYLIRAYHQCLYLLKNESVRTKLIPDQIMKIKRGSVSKEDVMESANLLESMCEKHRETTNLRDSPTDKVKEVLQSLLSSAYA